MNSLGQRRSACEISCFDFPFLYHCSLDNSTPTLRRTLPNGRRSSLCGLFADLRPSRFPIAFLISFRSTPNLHLESFWSVNLFWNHL